MLPPIVRATIALSLPALVACAGAEDGAETHRCSAPLTVTGPVEAGPGTLTSPECPDLSEIEVDEAGWLFDPSMPPLANCVRRERQGLEEEGAVGLVGHNQEGDELPSGWTVYYDPDDAETECSHVARWTCDGVDATVLWSRDTTQQLYGGIHVWVHAAPSGQCHYVIPVQED